MDETTKRLDQAVVTYNQAFKTHATKIVSVEKRAAAEVSRLQKALTEERIERAAVEKSLADLRAIVDTTGRETARDVEYVQRSVEDLDVALAETIRKSQPKPKRQTVIRDERGRVSEVIVETEGSDTATIRRVLRDANQRVIGAEEYQVPIEVEP